MLKMIKSISKNNKGSAIVVVIIALAFVGILSATAMWLSMSNYRMKATDRGIKGNFYTAETVFEEIIAGLQGESSDAAAVAYRKVLQNYVVTSGESDRYSRFVKFYKEELVNNLHDASLSGQYNQSRIRSYLDDALAVRLDPISPVDGNKFTMTGQMEVSADGFDYITLKGFRLEFTDDKGYYSVIETDIMLTAPKVDFTMSSSMPEIFKYAIVADKELEIAAETNVKGNIYVGEEGTKLNGAKLSVDNAEYVISMGPVELTNYTAKLNIGHSDATINTQFWAKDINITSSSKSTIRGGSLDIDADVYVADDLTLDAANSDVKLSGTYTGYGNSGSDASKSSAIMVNNLNSRIDMSGLSNLTLAGYSFINLSSYYKDPTTRKLYEQSGAVEVSANNIGTGESIAIKSDQVAFLVPDECLWVKPSKANTICSRNPVEFSSVAAIITDPDVCDGDVNRIGSGASGQSGIEIYEVMTDKDLGNGETLSSYINSPTDIVRVYSNKVAGHKTDRLVYYYMKMPADKAKEFIREYYLKDPEKRKEYFDVYSDGIDIPGNVNTTGSFVADKVGGTVTPVNELIKESTVNTPADNQALTDSITSYKAIISSLTEGLTEGGYINSTIETATPESHVFENIINETGTNGISTLLGANETKRFTLDDGHFAVVTNVSNFLYDSSFDAGKNCRLIIAQGNVDISQDFTGVIFAKGKVTVSSGCTITSVEQVLPGSNAKSELVRVLQCKFGTGGPTKENLTPIDMFKDGSSYVLAGTQVMERDDAGTVSSKVSVLDTVNYKNWIKK